MSNRKEVWIESTISEVLIQIQLWLGLVVALISNVGRLALQRTAQRLDRGLPSCLIQNASAVFGFWCSLQFAPQRFFFSYHWLGGRTAWSVASCFFITQILVDAMLPWNIGLAGAGADNVEYCTSMRLRPFRNFGGCWLPPLMLHARHAFVSRSPCQVKRTVECGQALNFCCC